jgi:hypothetical protein
MNRISKLAAATLGIVTVVSLAGPAQARGNANVQAVVQSNFATRQAQLRQEISADVANGSLSPSVAASLMAQLDQINADTQANIYGGGGISNLEANRLNNLFTNVTVQLQNSTGTASAYNGFNTFNTRYGAGLYNRNLNLNLRNREMLYGRQYANRYRNWF